MIGLSQINTLAQRKFTVVYNKVCLKVGWKFKCCQVETYCDVIYQTRGTVFYQDIQTPRNGLKNEAQPNFFLTNFNFGYLIKHSFECNMALRKLIIKCGENKEMKLPKSMLILKDRVSKLSFTVAISLS